MSLGSGRRRSARVRPRGATPLCRRRQNLQAYLLPKPRRKKRALRSTAAISGCHGAAARDLQQRGPATRDQKICARVCRRRGCCTRPSRALQAAGGVGAPGHARGASGRRALIAYTHRLPACVVKFFVAEELARRRHGSLKCSCRTHTALGWMPLLPHASTDTTSSPAERRRPARPGAHAVGCLAHLSESTRCRPALMPSSLLMRPL